MAIKTIHRSVKTPEEHYLTIEEALTNVLRACKADVNPAMMEQLVVYDRCLRVALGLPVELDG